MTLCKIPLNVVLALLVLLSCATVAIVAAVPSLLFAEQSAEAMGAELVEASVRASLDSVKAAAVGWATSTRALERIVDRYDDSNDGSGGSGGGSLSPAAEGRLVRSMLDLLAELEPEGITYLTVATEREGYFWGLESATPTQWNLRIRNASVPCRTRFSVPNRGNTRNITLVRTTEVSCSYDPRLRSWYRQLNQSRVVDITTAVIYSSKPELGLTFGRQILFPNGTVFGVAVVDITTISLSAVLNTLSFGRTGQALLLELPSMVVIATSTNELLLTGYNNSAPVQATATTTTIRQLQTNYARVALSEAESLVTSTANVSTTTFVSGPVWWVAVRDLRLTPRMHWRVVVVVPADDYLGPVRERKNTTTGVVVAVVVAATALVFVLLWLLLRPIAALQERVAAITRLEFHSGGSSSSSNNLSVSSPATTASNTSGTSAIAEIAALQKHMDGLQNAVASFARYIPKEVVKDMLFAGEGVAQIGMAPAHICVLFADIVGFTGICETTTTAQLSTLLSAFFDRSVSVLLRQGATIDKFIGDAIMAFWGAPVPAEHPEVMACLGVLHMQAEVASAVAPLFAAEGHALDVTYGLNSGQALVGNIGCMERIAYTAVGDEVNVAARLEGANKAFGTRVLLSEAVRERISSGSFLVSYLGKVRVVGRNAPMRVYTLLDVIGGAGAGGGLLPALLADTLDATSSAGGSDGESNQERGGYSRRASAATSRQSNGNASEAEAGESYAAQRQRRRRRRNDDFATLSEAMAAVHRLRPRVHKLEAAAAHHLSAAMLQYDKGPEERALAGARQQLRLCEEALRMLEGAVGGSGVSRIITNTSNKTDITAADEETTSTAAVTATTTSDTHHDLACWCPAEGSGAGVLTPHASPALPHSPLLGLSVAYVQAVAERCASASTWTECVELLHK